MGRGGGEKRGTPQRGGGPQAGQGGGPSVVVGIIFIWACLIHIWNDGNLALVWVCGRLHHNADRRRGACARGFPLLTVTDLDGLGVPGAQVNGRAHGSSSSIVERGDKSKNYCSFVMYMRCSLLVH